MMVQRICLTRTLMRHGKKGGRISNFKKVMGGENDRGYTSRNTKGARIDQNFMRRKGNTSDLSLEKIRKVGGRKSLNWAKKREGGMSFGESQTQR